MTTAGQRLGHCSARRPQYGNRFSDSLEESFMQDQVTSSDSADRVAQLEAGRMAAPLAPGGPQPCWRRRERILKAGDRPAGRG
jgi:hypothetical protein